MKKVLVFALILIIFTCIFISCGDETETSDRESERISQSQSESKPEESESQSKYESSTDSNSQFETDTIHNESQSSSEESVVFESSTSSYTEPFSISTTIKNCVITNDTIEFSVEKDVNSFSFINAFSIPSNFKWELHWDQACLSQYNIVSKTVDLEDGDNVLYALFINKNDTSDIYLYEIQIFKKVYYDITPADAVTLANQLEYEFCQNYPNDYFSPIYLYDLFYDLGYSEESWEYAYENCDINWTKHAEKLANIYTTYKEEFGRHASWFTAEEVNDAMLEEGFSYLTRNTVLDNIDWDLQLQKYVQHLSNFYDDFSRLLAKSILDDIVSNESGIDFALENSNIDWKNHALIIAKNRLIESENYESPLTDLELKEELMNVYDFTEEEANYAIENCR